METCGLLLVVGQGNRSQGGREEKGFGRGGGSRSCGGLGVYGGGGARAGRMQDAAGGVAEERSRVRSVLRTYTERRKVRKCLLCTGGCAERKNPKPVLAPLAPRR